MRPTAMCKHQWFARFRRSDGSAVQECARCPAERVVPAAGSAQNVELERRLLALLK